jgi:fibronectin-binding autotransporter adhesin
MQVLSTAIMRVLAAVMFLFAVCTIANAQTRTWTGGGAPDPNWSNAANWAGGVPNPLDTLIFGTATLTNSNNNTPAGTIYGGITFEPGPATYNLTGNGIVLGGNLVDQSFSAQTIALPMELNDSRTIEVIDAGLLTLSGVVSSAGDFGLTKTGPGKLTLGAVNTYTGATVIDGGTLAYATDHAGVSGIAFGFAPTDALVSEMAGALDLTGANVTTTSLVAQTNSATANTITIGSGKTLTVNGPFTVGVSPTYTNNFAGVSTTLNVGGDLNAVGDRLVVNSGENLFRVGRARANAAAGGDPLAMLDLSGLSNFTHTGDNHFRVGNGNARGEMNLANTSNTITADWVRIGDSGQDGGGTGGSENNNAGRSFLRLGTGTNVINADMLIIGRTKSGGTIEFQEATGSLVIAGQAGGMSTANIQIGSSDNATGGNLESMLSLAGHNATVQGGNVVIGQLSGGGAGSQSARGNVNFDTGTFNAQSLRLGVNATGAATVGAFGVFTLGGPDPGSAATGVLNVANEFFLAQRTNTNDTAGPSTATFIVNGGTANINTDILDASTTMSTAGPNLTTLTLTAGTLNMMGHDIGSADRSITSINLVGGTLNNAATIAGKAITLVTGVNVTGTPTYVLDNSELTGTLDTFGFGTLTLVSGGGLQGGGNVTGSVVAASGSRIAVGTSAAADTLTFLSELKLNNNSSVRFKLSENPVAGNDQATVMGSFDVSSGTVNLELEALGMGPQSGSTYTLFTYQGALVGNQSNFAVSGPLSQSRLTFVVVPTATTPNAINLQVGGAGPMDLRWVGNVNSQWDLVGDANWQGAAQGPQQFFTLDNVTFDDTSTNMNDVELVGQLQPSSVNVSAARNYRFAGTGGITGGAGLIKNGAGTLTLATDNSYAGTTFVNAGALIVFGNNTTTGETNIASGATVQVGAGGASGSLGAGPVNNEGLLVFNRIGELTARNVIAGTGELRHSGAGTVTLSAVNTYTGPTNITAGTLRVTDETSLGDLTGGAITVSSGAALDLAGSATANGIDFGAKQFRIAGTGVGGTGALTNSGTVGQNNAFEQVVLTGNATVGGTGRFDIRGDTSVLDLASFTLTKVGPNQFSLVGTTVSNGNIVVNEGVFAIETISSLSSLGSMGTITYNPGATAQFFNLTGDVSRPMIFNGGNTIGNASAQDSTVGSNITLAGNVTFTNLNNSTGALTMTGNLSETGGPRSVTKNGPTTLNLAGTSAYTGTTTITGGTFHIPAGAMLTTNNAVTTAAGSTFAVDGTASVGGISGGGATTVGGDLIAATLNARHVRQTSLNIAVGSVVNTTVGGGTSVLGNLAIAGTPNAPTAKFNLNDAAILEYTGASPVATVRQQILAGRGGPGFGATWTGQGITSSAAAAADAESRSIGYAENSSLPLGPYTNFRGQPVDDTSIIMAFTRTGDANLDGLVNDDDVTIVGATYAPGIAQPHWALGDFDYNGFVDDDDVTLLGVFYDPSAPPLVTPAPVAASGVAAVPEPGSLILAAFALAAVAAGGARRTVRLRRRR